MGYIRVKTHLPLFIAFAEFSEWIIGSRGLIFVYRSLLVVYNFHIRLDEVIKL